MVDDVVDRKDVGVIARDRDGQPTDLGRTQQWPAGIRSQDRDPGAEIGCHSFRGRPRPRSKFLRAEGPVDGKARRGADVAPEPPPRWMRRGHAGNVGPVGEPPWHAARAVDPRGPPPSPPGPADQPPDEAQTPTSCLSVRLAVHVHGLRSREGLVLRGPEGVDEAGDGEQGHQRGGEVGDGGGLPRPWRRTR